MLDVRFICENAEAVKQAMATRSGSYDVQKVVDLDEKRRAIIGKVEALKAEKNRSSEEVKRARIEKRPFEEYVELGKKLGEEIKTLDEELAQVEVALKEAVLAIPNVPSPTTPIGKDDADNVTVRTYGTPTEFSFAPKAHWEIGESLGILDFPTAVKISGARFALYKGLGSRLERAIMNFMLDTHTESGYTEVFPPFMVNRDSMIGTGQLPKFEEDMYAVKGTDLYMIPTAEVPVTNMLRNEIVDEADLPIKYTAYTACFRGEAGSAGRDTRGLIRLHQFNKVELVKFCTLEQSYAELESLTNDAEKILQLLGLPYRVSLLCTGDTGFSSAKTYDIEVWMPSYGRYVEISSCSNFENYQARRANIKYRPTGEKKAKLVATLNGSGLAIGRTTAAILENFQNEDGTVTIPGPLVPYMGTDTIE